MSNEEALVDLAQKVNESKSINLFLEFLEKFKEVEAEHIQNLLSKSDIRSANLCAEAYATADLIITTIKES